MLLRNFSTSSLLALVSPLLLAASIASAEPIGDTTDSNRGLNSANEPEPSWEFEKADPDAGWQLYTSEVEGSAHPRFLLIGESPEPVERVAQALRLKLHDIRYMQEGYDRKILSSGEGFMINYVRMDVPVVSDRDVVLDTRWWTDSETSTYHVQWAPPDGELPPVPDGVSRIESRGSWEISPLPGGGSRLVYTQHSELGDSIPAWLIGSLLKAQMISEYTTLDRIVSNDLPAVAAPHARDPSHTRVPSTATSLVD